jgi:plasmid stabilization system protein ParE
MNVSYRAGALEDIHAIYQWRLRQSTDVAEKVEAAIFAAADWLGEHPKFGLKTDEANVRR